MGGTVVRRGRETGEACCARLRAARIAGGCGLLAACAALLTVAPAAPAADAVPAAIRPAGGAEASAERAARERVEGFHAVLIDVMKSSDSLPFDARLQQVADALDSAFDIAFMARASVGKIWKTLDPQQQSEWVALSRRYSASSYAKNFKGWSGQRFETHGVEPAARKTLTVKTELVQPSDDNVAFDYRLRKADDGWRIIDIQIDGKVSEITMRRADYRSVIERKGFDELMADVQGKIADFARE